MHGNILPKQSVSVKIFHKVLLKEMCLSQYFNMHMEKFYWNKVVSIEKSARTVLDQKCFSHIFTKFYQNKSVSFNILIWTWKFLLKQSVSIEKKCKNSAWSKVFLSLFIKFYWNKCVSINILICAWKILLKHFVLVEIKQQELCLIKSVSVTFL